MNKIIFFYIKTANYNIFNQDPIKYNDEVSDYFDAKPSYLANIPILWRLLFSSCGPAQWRYKVFFLEKNIL